MVCSKHKILLLVILAIFMVGCEDEMTPLASYVPIDAQLWGLEFQGYDGYIVADWEITNTADVSISGWEIHIKIVMINDQTEQGLFFRHDVTMAPGDSARFAGNVFFHRDAVSIYPVALTTDNAAMKSWDIITIRGLVE